MFALLKHCCWPWFTTRYELAHDIDRTHKCPPSCFEEMEGLQVKKGLNASKDFMKMSQCLDCGATCSFEQKLLAFQFWRKDENEAERTCIVCSCKSGVKCGQNC